MPRRRNKFQSRERMTFRLRTAVLMLLLSTLLGTVLVVATVAYISTRQSVEDLSNRYLASTATSVRHKVDARIRSAESVLLYLAGHQELLLTPPLDWQAVGMALARVIATDEGLEWVSYGQESDGLFVGANRRPDGEIIVNYSVADDGPEAYDYLMRDGQLVYDGPGPPDFDPRNRPWYQDAVRARGIAWSEPYTFYGVEERGITTSLPIYTKDGELRGVLTIDLTVTALQHFLEETRGDSAGSIFILSPQGQLIAGTAPQDDVTVPTPAELRAAVMEDNGTHRRVLSFGGQAYATLVDHISLGGGGQIMLAVLVSTDEYLHVARYNAIWASSIGALAVLTAIVLGYRFTQRMTRPLREVSQELDRIGRFDLTGEAMQPSRIAEVTTVIAAAERMKAGLRSFSRYVPAELVRSLLANGEEAKLGGQVREVTMMFSDLANFTWHSESRTPDRVVEDLSAYFETTADALARHKGTLVQFVGDGIFAFFNAPLPVPDHSAAACRAALDSQRRLREVNEQRQRDGRILLEQRIGLHTDRVVVGNVGTADHLTYTAMGDGVNLTSRLESLNKVYGTHLLASDAVQQSTGDQFHWRQLDRVVVKGRAHPTDVFELLGVSGEVDERLLLLRDAYERALAIYFEGHFTEAAARFEALVKRYGDPASATLAARCRQYIDAPPRMWDGVAVLGHK